MAPDLLTSTGELVPLKRAIQSISKYGCSSLVNVVLPKRWMCCRQLNKTSQTLQSTRNIKERLGRWCRWCFNIVGTTWEVSADAEAVAKYASKGPERGEKGSEKRRNTIESDRTW
jgi:hypothetical protein